VRRVPMTVCLATLVTLAACNTGDSSGSSASPTPSPPTADQLNGHAFVSTSVTGYDLVADSQIRLAFDGGNLSANAGCNTMSGAFTIQDGTLKLTAELASTQMACQPDLMSQDTWLAAFLKAGPAITVEGDTLALAAGDVVLELVDEAVASPSPTLTGTKWTLEAVVQGEGVSSVPTDVPPPTLAISDQGEATVFTSCNRGHAAVDIGDTTLTFGPMAGTKKACPGDAGALETAVVTLLDGEVTYVIDGQRLTLTKGAQGLVYLAP
jgi:heat shock protein HslJ